MMMTLFAKEKEKTCEEGGRSHFFHKVSDQRKTNQKVIDKEIIGALQRCLASSPHNLLDYLHHIKSRQHVDIRRSTAKHTTGIYQNMINWT